VSLLSLDEIPTLTLSNIEDNDSSIYDFHFDIGSREATDVASFEHCEDMPPLYGSCRSDSSSDKMYTTHQSNNDSSFEIILYQFSL
jgi:hypothetical protein